MGKVRNLSMEERIKVVVLSEEGFSAKKIAEKLKCSHSTVVRLLKKDGRQEKLKTEHEMADQGSQLAGRTGSSDDFHLQTASLLHQSWPKDGQKVVQ